MALKEGCVVDVTYIENSIALSVCLSSSQSNGSNPNNTQALAPSPSMAPKRQQPPIEDLPSASSSEEEETSSGEEEDEESDDGSKKQIQKPSSPPPPPPPQQTKTVTTQKGEKPDQPQSDSESESGSESESESDAELDQTVKPIASKPMELTPSKTAAAVKNARSKTPVTSPPAKSAVKRGNETDRDSKDAKRAKNKEVEVEKSEDTKRTLFQRLWTEDDEIAVLKGILEFTEKNGFDPSKDMNAFIEFIKKSLHFDVSNTQLKDKIYRLKKKFENHVKGKKGEEKTFSKSHDQKIFDLSKNIWGSEGISGGGAESSVKANGRKNGNRGNNKTGNAKKIESLKAELGMDVGEEGDRMEVEMERGAIGKDDLKFDRTVGVGGMENYIVERGLDFVEGAKKEEMEKEWRKLHVAQLELFLKRNALVREQAKLMLAAFKSEED